MRQRIDWSWWFSQVYLCYIMRQWIAWSCWFSQVSLCYIRSLFVPLSFLCQPLYCLYFDIRLQIAPLVSYLLTFLIEPTNYVFWICSHNFCFFVFFVYLFIYYYFFFTKYAIIIVLFIIIAAITTVVDAMYFGTATEK